MAKDKKLRIAMLGHKRVPSREGGIEIVVEQIGSRMVERGHQVVCYNRSGHHVSGREFDEPELSEWKGMRLKPVFTLDRKGAAAVTSSFFAALRAAFGRYDVVHFHAEGPCAMLWLPKLFGKRCVCTVHGLDHQQEKWKGSFGQKYILFGERVAVRFADEIIVLNRREQAYFEQQYGRKTVLIPNGVSQPERKAPELILEKYGLDRNGYILYLGRIIPGKGLPYLVDAYRQLHTDKKLVIAGGASDTEQFMSELKAQAASDPNILFTGFVQGQLLDELYSNACLFVLPSDHEGMPLSLLEAMSYGSCCVVSDIPECAEVVEDKAVVFPRGSVSALRDTLQHLCDHPEAVEQYQNTSAAYILRKYSWDETTDKTLALYGQENGMGSKA